MIKSYLYLLISCLTLSFSAFWLRSSVVSVPTFPHGIFVSDCVYVRDFVQILIMHTNLTLVPIRRAIRTPARVVRRRHSSNCFASSPNHSSCGSIGHYSVWEEQVRSPEKKGLFEFSSKSEALTTTSVNAFEVDMLGRPRRRCAFAPDIGSYVCKFSGKVPRLPGAT